MAARRIHQRTELTPEQKADQAKLRQEAARKAPVSETVAEGGGIASGDYAILREFWHGVKAERERQGLTQSQVADNLKMDPAAYSRLESGRTMNPTVFTLLRVCAALGGQLALQLSPDRPAEPNGLGQPVNDMVIASQLVDQLRRVLDRGLSGNSKKAAAEAAGRGAAAGMR